MLTSDKFSKRENIVFFFFKSCTIKFVQTFENISFFSNTMVFEGWLLVSQPKSFCINWTWKKGSSNSDNAHSTKHSFQIDANLVALLTNQITAFLKTADRRLPQSMMGYFSTYSGSDKPTILRFFQRLLSENIFNLLDKLVWQTSLELDEEKL